MHPQIDIPTTLISTFCERYKVQKLALFGSVLRGDFGPDSDIDVLIEFHPTARVGLFDLAAMAQELTLLLGRKVDLFTPGFLSPHIRHQVKDSSLILYEEAS